MWKIFFSKKTDFNHLISIIEEWKKLIFAEQEMKIKEYFATKVVIYFDNKMIFHQKNGLHHNLLESLSQAEKEMPIASSLYKPIKAHLLREEKGFSLLLSGLKDSKVQYLPFNETFKVVEINMGNIDKPENLEFNAWSNLIFSFNLVNFSQNWINFTPNLEQRSELQAQHILFNMTFRKSEASLLERVDFEKNIHHHPQYQELLEKVLKVMPKIESSLEQEWRTKIIDIKSYKKSKKTNI